MLMRYLIPIITGTALVIAGCQSPRSGPLAGGAAKRAEVICQGEHTQTLRAFGGTLIGKNFGEFGGGVFFRKAGGSIYPVTDILGAGDNSHGIFAMPYGVVAVTGLAHLGFNHGAIYLISRSTGSRVDAEPLMKLPGAPSHVVRIGNRISMRILTDPMDGSTLADLMHKKGIHVGNQYTVYAGRGTYSCYVLQPDKDLVRYECQVPQPDVGVGCRAHRMRSIKRPIAARGAMHHSHSNLYSAEPGS